MVESTKLRGEKWNIRKGSCTDTLYAMMQTIEKWK